MISFFYERLTKTEMINIKKGRILTNSPTSLNNIVCLHYILIVLFHFFIRQCPEPS